MDALINVYTRRQVLLERLKASYSKNYSSVIVKKLDRAFRDVLSAVEGGDDAMSRLGQLDKILNSLRAKQSKIYQDFLREMIAENLDFVGDAVHFEAEALNLVTKDVKMGVVSATVAMDFVNKAPIRATGTLLSSFYTDWMESEIKGAEAIVRNGFWSGKTGQQMLTELRGTKKNRYSDGFLARNDRNAETIIRTGYQHIANTVRAATWEENDDIVEGYKIVATLDSRTSTICRSLDQKEFKLGKGPVPPLHPRCRSTTVPVLSPQYRAVSEGTRSSKDGYVAGDISYYEWLKGQPAGFQELALGKTRAKLFRDGGISAAEFGRLNLNRNFEPMTLAEMRAANPEVFDRAGL